MRITNFAVTLVIMLTAFLLLSSFIIDLYNTRWAAYLREHNCVEIVMYPEYVQWYQCDTGIYYMFSNWGD